MFLVNVPGMVFTIIYLTSFVLCYFVILFTNVEKLFKQGSVWQIRIFQAILAFILAYFMTLGIKSLIEAFEI